MARRSPMNERYQKNTAPAGKTRKSAASAKPKRNSDAAPVSKSSAKKQRTSAFLPNPDTDEFRLWRKIWWAMLISSAVFTFGSIALQRWTEQKTLGMVMLGVGYALIFGALAIDWFKIRKMRNEWIAAQKSDASPKSDKTS